MTQPTPKDDSTFTTSSGRIVKLKRIGRRHVERIRALHPLPGPPTYTFTAAGGEQVTKEHDGTTLETEEDRAVWAQYQKDRGEAVAAQHQAITEFLIFHCIDEDPPPPEEWSVDFAAWGVPPPDPSDPIRYKVEWFESEIAVDPDDFAALTALLYEKGGLVDSSRVAEMEAFFRAIMGRLAAAGADSDSLGLA